MVKKYLKSKENQILMRFDVSRNLCEHLIIHFFGFRAYLKEGENRFLPSKVMPEGQKSIIGYLKRLPNALNRIKILFTFILW